MTDQERIANLEKQVSNLSLVVSRLLYQIAVRGVLPYVFNEDLVKDLDAIFDALLPTPGGQQTEVKP